LFATAKACKIFGVEEDTRAYIELGVRVLSRIYDRLSTEAERKADIKALRALAETEEKHMADDELACRVIHRAIDRTKKSKAESA
jgi:hypothetical protein